MNTSVLRCFVVLLAGSFAVASPTAAGEAPDLLRWHRYTEPVFPPQLLSTQVLDGFASVVFAFDEAGFVTDRIVTAASHPAFTASVIEATRHWQIDTSSLSRHLRRETLRFNFHRSGSIVTMTNRDATKAAFSPYGDLAAIAVSTCGEDALDRPLKVLTTVHAEYPPELKARGTRGHATVSFIVDAAGRVRVPAVTAATEVDFENAALAALRQWTFAPAQQRGLPVQVIAERTFVFGAVAGEK